jgi:hypothetical protein
MRSLCRCGIHFLLIAAAAFGLLTQARADTVNLGTDYLQTLPGTFFNFTLPGLGTVPVPFMGNPIGPGNTDTIVERLANATVTPGGVGDTIPIKLVALSLQSTSPVDVGGTFFNVFVTLDPTKLSKNTGFMTILENAAGTGGTFSSIFTVFFQAKFVPVGGGTGFSVFSSLVLQNGVPGSGVGAAWVSTFPPGFVQVTGPCGDQDANVHTGCACNERRLTRQTVVWASMWEQDAGRAGNGLEPQSISCGEPETMLRRLRTYRCLSGCARVTYSEPCQLLFTYA